MDRKILQRTALTARQAEVLEALRRLTREGCGLPPTRLELARALFPGRKVRASATDYHLNALAVRGLIEIVPNVARGLKIVDPDSVALYIAPARIHPDEALRTPDRLAGQVPKLLIPKADPPADYLITLTDAMRGAHAVLTNTTAAAIRCESEPQTGSLVLTRARGRLVCRRLEECRTPATIDGVVVGTVLTIRL